MKFPITKYGMPQVLIYPLAVIIVMAILWFTLKSRTPASVFWAIEVILFLFFAWQLSFFRDPIRKIPAGSDFFISPADGTINDIEIVEDCEFIGGKAKRIGIFLSVFNVHINRTPADVRIDKVVYKEGKFLDARSPRCGKENESNDVYMTMLKEPGCKLIVRQISGAIARHIVCPIKSGDEFKLGDQFGMIKYGSRTELYFPADLDAEVLVKEGDKVKAGLTKLVQFK